MSVLNKLNRAVGKYIPDKLYIKLLYFKNFHSFPNLYRPKTYTEKCQWLKLYNRKREYSLIADKIEVKRIISDIVGKEYVIETLGVYESFEDIDFDVLPDKFVIKCSHDSGGIRICKEKSCFDYKEAQIFFERRMKHNYFYDSREYPYKNVKPRLMVEPYIVNESVGELRDYKFLTFNGIPRIMYVASGRFKQEEKVCFDFYDMEFRHLDLINEGFPQAATSIIKPRFFDKMKEIATKLSTGFPTIRVDFYETDDRLYVGEMTFFHEGGMVPFLPSEWDTVLGDWITEI